MLHQTPPYLSNSHHHSRFQSSRSKSPTPFLLLTLLNRQPLPLTTHILLPHHSLFSISCILHPRRLASLFLELCPSFVLGQFFKLLFLAARVVSGRCFWLLLLGLQGGGDRGRGMLHWRV